MTTPSRVRACVERLTACAGALDERIERVDVRGTPDADLRAELCAAARDWCDQGFGTFAALDALGDELAINQIEGADGELRLIFGKRPTASTFYFLTAQGIGRLLAALEAAHGARRVLVAEAFASFRTTACSYGTWTEMVEDVAADDDRSAPVPRRIVRDQLAIVPLSVGPILLIQQPDDTSDVFAVWRAAACPQLLTCLCDEIWRHDGEVRVMLTGPRRRQIAAALDAIDPERDLPLLTETAEWIYNSGRDVETRHTLFAYELAREWPGDTPFASGFSSRASGSLEAAKTAFRMHVRDASKETLKSLQDLRKTLADDVTRVVTQTRELSGAMWRDLLVVLAAILGRFTLLSSPATEEVRLADWLLLGLAAYLLISIGITVFSSNSFLTIFREAQEKWKTKLYGFVDPEDFKTLATEPLGKAETVYRRTRNAAIVAYGLTMVALLALANFSTKAPAVPPPALGRKPVPEVTPIKPETSLPLPQTPVPAAPAPEPGSSTAPNDATAAPHP